MWDKTVWGLHLQSGQYLLRELVSTKRRLLGFKGKPTTTQHRNHQIATTHTTTKKKIKIKERKQIGDKIDLEEEIDQRVADDEINPEEEMI